MLYELHMKDLNEFLSNITQEIWYVGENFTYWIIHLHLIQFDDGIDFDQEKHIR